MDKVILADNGSRVDILLGEDFDEKILTLIRLNVSIRILISMPSINVTQSPQCVMYDHARASYIVETLDKYCIILDLIKDFSTSNVFYILEIESFNDEKLLSKFIHQLPMLNKHYDEITDSVSEYYDQVMVHDVEVKFSEIIDDFFANYLNGAIFEQEYFQVAGSFIDFPERRYGYWRSPCHKFEKSKPTLMSLDDIIVPIQNKDIASLIEETKCYFNVSILKAELVSLNSDFFLISEMGVVKIALDDIYKTYHVYNSTKESRIPETDENVDEDSDMAHELLDEIRELRKPPYLPSITTCYVSEFKDFIVLGLGELFLIKKDPVFCDINSENEILNKFNSVLSVLEDKANNTYSKNIPWDKISDDDFENLCVEILSLHSSFKKQLISKMGKSRSSDCGRDIVAYKQELKDKSLKYIFQCKLIQSQKSLKKSNLGSVTDVISQFGADAYGVFCSCVIDSRVYDLLDGIKTNNNKEYDVWDLNRISTFLRRRPYLIERYFVKKS